MKPRHFLCLLLLLSAMTSGLAADDIRRLDPQLEGQSWSVRTAEDSFVTLWFRPANPNWQLVSRGFDGTTSYEIGPPTTNPLIAVTTSPRDTILVTWFDDLGFIRGQFLDSDGAPDGSDFSLVPAGGVVTSIGLAADTDGFSVVWTTGSGFSFFQRLDNSGATVGDRITRSAPFDGFGVGGRAHLTSLAANGNGMVGASSSDQRRDANFFTTLGSARVTANGSSLGGSELAVAPVQSSFELAIAADAGLGYGVVYSRFDPSDNGREIWFQRLDLGGLPATSPRRVDPGPEPTDVHSPRIACDLGGACIVLWQRGRGQGSKIFTRTYDSLAHPFGPARPLINYDTTAESGANVTFDRQGEALFTAFVEASDPQGPPQPTGLLAIRRALPCRPGLDTVCLREGRFAVQVTLEDDLHATGFPAPAEPMTSDTGGFWFFSQDNLEVLVKVLDGRPVNGHFWVLFGSLSNLAYTVTVTDTSTGETRQFANPEGTLASQANTEAFTDDGSPLTVAAPAPDSPPGACPALSDAALCLTNARFRATVEWIDPRSGRTGFGVGRLISENSGAFWFFGPENLELIVKVLDGRVSNSHFWVFVGSLTDVEYEIRIDDDVTGESWTYRKPPFSLESHADIEALPAP
ncbi:MAG: hypothetical protein AAF604_02140 [Acidobacteriota bacterium]